MNVSAMRRKILILELVCCIFFFKQKTAYEMRISDWSSDVCSSDLVRAVSRLQARCGLAAVLQREFLGWVTDRPRDTTRLQSTCPAQRTDQIVRASGRERVCQDG